MNWTQTKAIPGTCIKGDTWELVCDGLYGQANPNGTWMLGEDELVVGKSAKILNCGVASDLNAAKVAVEKIILERTGR